MNKERRKEIAQAQLITLETRLARIQALTFNPGDSVLANGNPKCAMTLNFTDEGKPYATGLENARVFTKADRMGDNRSPLLKHSYFNEMQERAMLYDAAMMQRYAIEAVQGALELIQGMIQQAA